PCLHWSSLRRARFTVAAERPTIGGTRPGPKCGRSRKGWTCTGLRMALTHPLLMYCTELASRPCPPTHSQSAATSTKGTGICSCCFAWVGIGSSGRKGYRIWTAMGRWAVRCALISSRRRTLPAHATAGGRGNSSGGYQHELPTLAEKQVSPACLNDCLLSV